MDAGFVDTVKEEVDSKNSLCRLCASCTELLIPIFEREGLENNLPEKIDKYLPIQIAPSDVLPLQVCFQCASTVLSWHELTTTCIKAEQKLQSMFGKNETLDCDPVLSPADSRRDDPDIFVDSAPSPGVSENNDIQSSLDDNAAEVHQDQDEAIRKKQNIREPQGGDIERFIAEVTEEIDDDVVCVDVEESSKTLKTTENCSSIDHSYTREPLKVTQFNPKPLLHGREQHSQPILPRLPIKTVFQTEPQGPTVAKRQRLILPRPTRFSLDIVAKPLGSSQNQSLKSITSSSQLSPSKMLLVCSKVASGQKPLLKPFLVPLESLESGPQGTTKNVRAVSTKSSPQQIVRGSPQSVAKAKSFLKSKVGFQSSSKVSSRMSAPSSHFILPKLREITVTKVPSQGTVVKPLRKSPKASVSLFRKPMSSFACTICAAQFSHEVMRKRHMFLKHGVKQYSCEQCKSSYGRKDELLAHIRLIHPMKIPNVSNYTCRVCKESFSKLIDLKLHARVKHLTRKVSMHQNIQLAIKQKKVIAGVAITEKEAEWLQDFCQTQGNKEVLNCNICKRTWGSLEKAVVHIRTHTKEQLYSCDICGQKFNTRGVLIRHNQVHNNTKPFGCDYCDKFFSSKQNRDDHHRFHTKEAKTVCESCGEFLTSASMLYYHRKIHSGVNPYKCPYCEKAYSIRSLLKRHIRYHTGEKPHLCSVCGRGFKTSGQLRGHSAVHSDARPYSCEGCNSLFKTTKYLNRHRAICNSVQSKVSNAKN